MRNVTAAQMQRIDRLAQEKYAIPGLILMEHAGQAVAGAVWRLLGSCRGKQALIFCGPGNNAGDGFVAARHLAQAGVRVMLFLLADPAALRGDTALNFAIIRRLRIPWRWCREKKDFCRLAQALQHANVVIDAMFGIGLRRPVSGVYRRVIKMLNASGVPVISVDVPSGLCATTGRIWGCCVRAAHTVTFGLPKRGFYAGHGPQYTGTIEIADIGLPQALRGGIRRNIRTACK